MKYGIVSYGAYVPYRRLSRKEISEVMGAGGGSGTRSVASFDEDTTTMAVEAARVALRDAASVGASDETTGGAQQAKVNALWFSTASPAYMEKTNAGAIHAALRLPPETLAADFAGAARSGVAALWAGLLGAAEANTLVVASDIRVGLATSRDESEGGDGAAALLVGKGTADIPVLAECIATASATKEFTDRWRAPGEVGTKQWEERFAESQYVPLFEQAWAKASELASGSQGSGDAGDIDTLIVTGTHSRSVGRVAKIASNYAKNVISSAAGSVADNVGNTGTAHALLLLTQELENASPSQTIAVVSLIDGADVFIFRTTDAIAQHECSRPLERQVASGADVGYGKFLQWREQLRVQPPNRLEPDRPSMSAAARRSDWKFGFVGSEGQQSGTVHLPPARVSISGEDEVDAMTPVAMADVPAEVITYTVDRLVYSVSPPVVFAIVDFDGGGRLPVELTDVEPDEVEAGMKVEMTFRKMYVSDGIQNYFWKARPVRG